MDQTDLLKSQAQAIIDLAITTGQERRKVQGLDFNEVDYLVGVMTAMQALNMWNLVPAYWHMNILSGQTNIPLLPGQAEPTLRDLTRNFQKHIADLKEMMDLED